MTGERVNERRRLMIGPWVAGRLLLFDLGFFKWQLFDRIRTHHGYFISRLRDDVNPVIVAENRRWRGASRKLVGQRLRDVNLDLAREGVDLLVEVEILRRSYRGRCRRERAIFRAVGLAVSRAIWRRLRTLVEAGRRVSERRVTDALAAIAAELAVVLAGVPVSYEQHRRWQALLSAEAAYPNVGRATMKRAWGY